MIRRTAAAIALVGVTALTACQSQPQPCTPEWVEWKTDRVLERFARSNMDTVRALRDVPGDVDSTSAVTLMRFATLLDDFNVLARDFDRIVLPELNDAVAQCGQPQNFVPAFSEFLRDEGVSEPVIQWIEVLGYMSAGGRR